MRTTRLLFAAMMIALATSACADIAGPAQGGDCPTMGGGGTCEE